jgi:hypothetical protein
MVSIDASEPLHAVRLQAKSGLVCDPIQMSSHQHSNETLFQHYH